MKLFQNLWITCKFDIAVLSDRVVVQLWHKNIKHIFVILTERSDAVLYGPKQSVSYLYLQIYDPYVGIYTYRQVSNIRRT